MTSSGKNYVLALYLDPQSSAEFRSELLADFRALGFRLAGKRQQTPATIAGVVPGIPVVFVPDEAGHAVDCNLITQYARLLRTRPEVRGIDSRQHDVLLTSLAG